MWKPCILNEDHPEHPIYSSLHKKRESCKRTVVGISQTFSLTRFKSFRSQPADWRWESLAGNTPLRVLKFAFLLGVGSRRSLTLQLVR